MSAVAINIEKMVSVTEAAQIIGVTVGRVRQMLINGEMAGEKLSGNIWIIERKEAERIARKPHETGRPRSSQGGIKKSS